MIELICFLGGFSLCAALLLLWRRIEKGAQQPDGTAEVDSMTEAAEAAYLQQYRNFLNYCGSGKGQESIENKS